MEQDIQPVVSLDHREGILDGDPAAPNPFQVSGVEVEGIVLGVLIHQAVVCAAQGSRADPFAAGEVEVSLYWNVSQGMEGDDDEVPPSAGETSVDLSLSLEGPDSNRADATVVASLEAGWIRGFASGITPENPSGETGGIAVGRARGELEDRLTFTVAPGTYAVDVIVSVSGTVSGNFSVAGGGSSSARAVFSASFGSEDSDFTWDDEDGSAFLEDFVLSRQLVSEGTTLVDPRVVGVPVSVSLYVSGQSSGGGTVSSGTADFSQSARFLQVEVPDGVTWESESTVFLLLPEPSVGLMFGSALLVVAALRRPQAQEGSPAASAASSGGSSDSTT